MPQLEQVGTFRGDIVSFGVRASDSKAKAISIVVRIREVWAKPEGEDDAHEEWFDWSPHQLEVAGDVWIVKKDGTLNEKSVRNLVENAGWDGSFANVANGSWEPKPIQISVEENVYKGKTSYRIAWVNAYDSVPGVGASMSPEDVKELETAYGSQLRALVGTVHRGNATPPAGQPTKPAAPKKKATATVPASAAAIARSQAAAEAANQAVDDGTIPF